MLISETFTEESLLTAGISNVGTIGGLILLVTVIFKPCVVCIVAPVVIWTCRQLNSCKHVFDSTSQIESGWSDKLQANGVRFLATSSYCASEYRIESLWSCKRELNITYRRSSNCHLKIEALNKHWNCNYGLLIKETSRLQPKYRYSFQKTEIAGLYQVKKSCIVLSISSTDLQVKYLTKRLPQRKQTCLQHTFLVPLQMASSWNRNNMRK